MTPTDRSGSRIRRWWPAAAAILTGSLLYSCAAPKQQPNVANHKISVGTELAAAQVINRHLIADPPTLDPALCTDVPGFQVTEDLFEGLVTIGADAKILPGVAASWEVSPDGKTWTFHLRPNARWSNGEPLTAKDVVYGWRREVDPATAAEYAQSLTPIENASEIIAGKMDPSKLGVEAVNAQTVVAHLKQPTSYFLTQLTNSYFFPLYEPAIKQWGNSWVQPGHLVSNGAFTLSERILNGHITLLKNPYYWDAAHVKITKVTDFVVIDDSSAASQYLAGDIDFTDRISLSDKDLLQRTVGDQVVLAPYFGTVMFGYNLTKPPFAGNPKLRLAMNLAIDRDILTKYLRRGVNERAFTLMPSLPGFAPPNPDWMQLSDDDRHAMARKLYEEAGYSARHPLETVLTYPSGGPDARRLMEAMAAMWQSNLGAKVQLYNVEWKVFLQARQIKQPTLYWFAWIGDFPDPFTFAQLFQTGFPMNDGGYSNPQYDALLEQANSITDATKRFALYQQAIEILNNDAAYLPTYFWASSHLIKPYVKGWQTNVQDRHLSQYMYILAHQED